MIVHEIPAIPAPAGPGPTVRVPGRVCRDKTPEIQAVTGSMSGVPDTDARRVFAMASVPVSVGRKSQSYQSLDGPVSESRVGRKCSENNGLAARCRNRVSGRFRVGCRRVGSDMSGTYSAISIT